jgi:hypothetical protein
MIRTKKIRGHKRIWKAIDNWVQNCKQLDIDYLKSNQREYVKIWIQPFGNIPILNSVFAPPKGKTRRKIIAGILEIHNHWKKELDKLNEPYYLKIWFYNNDVSNSQVVCSIGELLDFYDKTFHKPKENKPFPSDSLGLQWEYRLNENHFTVNEIGEPDEFYSLQDYIDNKKMVKRIMKNPKTRISKFTNKEGETTTYYSEKHADVWLGSAN